jgi:mevalonate kinase
MSHSIFRRATTAGLGASAAVLAAVALAATASIPSLTIPAAFMAVAM